MTPARRGPRGGDAPPPPGTARLAAICLLGRRDYTVAELRQRLLAKGYVDTDVDAALDQLRAEGLQDDRRVAAAHVRTATRLKGRGPLRIKYELQARGVAPDAIDDSTSAVSEEDVREAIERLIARQRLPHPLSREDRQRLFQRLIRRGFPADAVLAALKK